MTDLTPNKLTGIEIEAFNSLEYDPKLEPYFDPMRYCLRWQDEEPECVSSRIYEKFLDLLITRSYIHKGLPKEKWFSIEPTGYFVEFWEHAESAIPSWPGFMRLQLNKVNRKYLEIEVNRDPSEFF